MLTVRFAKPEATNIPVIHAKAGQMVIHGLQSEASSKQGEHKITNFREDA